MGKSKPIATVLAFDEDGKQHSKPCSTVGHMKNSITAALPSGLYGKDPEAQAEALSKVWEFHILRYDGKGAPKVEIQRAYLKLEVSFKLENYAYHRTSWQKMQEVDLRTEPNEQERKEAEAGKIGY
jgi:hypothetical protein